MLMPLLPLAATSAPPPSIPPTEDHRGFTRDTSVPVHGYGDTAIGGVTLGTEAADPAKAERSILRRLAAGPSSSPPLTPPSPLSAESAAAAAALAAAVAAALEAAAALARVERSVPPTPPLSARPLAGGRVSLLPRTRVAAGTVAGGMRTAPDDDDGGDDDGGDDEDDEDDAERAASAVEVLPSPVFSYGWIWFWFG